MRESIGNLYNRFKQMVGGKQSPSPQEPQNAPVPEAPVDPEILRLRNVVYAIEDAKRYAHQNSTIINVSDIGLPPEEVAQLLLQSRRGSSYTHLSADQVINSDPALDTAAGNRSFIITGYPLTPDHSDDQEKTF